MCSVWTIGRENGAYIRVSETWGSGIPRIIREVENAGLKTPEFIVGDVDLRINVYRRVTGQAVGESSVKGSVKWDAGSEKTLKGSEKSSEKTLKSSEKMPDSGNDKCPPLTNSSNLHIMCRKLQNESMSLHA